MIEVPNIIGHVSPEQFANAAPFPNAVLNGLWNDTILTAIASEFPTPNDPRWQQYGMEQERGKRAGAAHMWGPVTHEFFQTMRSPAMCAQIETLTGLTGIMADDVGGGMHLSPEGARLGMHIDFNKHPTMPYDRRVNVLVFLNEEWDTSWGGDLLLTADRDAADPLRIAPLINRTVLFATSNHSWHGHPEPIVGEHYRRSLACYYYAPTPADDTEGAHTTVYANA